MERRQWGLYAVVPAILAVGLAWVGGIHGIRTHDHRYQDTSNNPDRQTSRTEMIEMMHWWYGSGWGYLAMAASMAAFWGLLVAAIVLVARAAGRPSTTRAAPEPQHLLALRFARGEIDETEYRDRLAALAGRRTPPAD